MTETSPPAPSSPARKPAGWLNLAVDYGPLIVFFAVYKFAAPADKSPVAEVAAVIESTVAFMLASVIALAVSKWKLGRVSPGLILTTVLVVGFGGLTIWFNDPRFIQIKPTIIYVMFAAILLGGWLRGKAMLKFLLEAAFEGVDEAGWLKTSRNWGAFFLLLAATNEIMRMNLGFDDWLWAKLWVFTPLSMVFALSQIPLLMRHGLRLDDGKGPGDTQPPQT